jgi:hypothetical protein
VEINEQFITNKIPALNAKNLADLISKINQKSPTATICIGPDALNLKEVLTPDQKAKIKDIKPENKDQAKGEITDQDLKELGLTREQLDRLNAPFLDPAELANIIKQLAQSNNPAKVAQMLDKLFEHLPASSREAIFNQMVTNNPVFTAEEKKNLKDLWEQAKTPADKKKV